MALNYPLQRDMINDMEIQQTARQPDPQELIDGYEQSAATLNLIRAFAQGGMANLEKVHEWTLGFLNDTPETDKYREIANRISENEFYESLWPNFQFCASI